MFVFICGELIYQWIAERLGREAYSHGNIRGLNKNNELAESIRKHYGLLGLVLWKYFTKGYSDAKRNAERKQYHSLLN